MDDDPAVVPGGDSRDLPASQAASGSRTRRRPLMSSLVALAQSLGLAYSSGVSLYATILLVGLMERAHWIAPLTGPWAIASHPIVLAIAAILAIFELGASLVPGIASVWETIHT